MVQTWYKSTAPVYGKGRYALLVPQQPGAREIKVKLMLAGGHAAMLVLTPEHPLLAQLLTTPIG